MKSIFKGAHTPSEYQGDSTEHLVELIDLAISGMGSFKHPSHSEFEGLTYAEWKRVRAQRVIAAIEHHKEGLRLPN